MGFWDGVGNLAKGIANSMSEKMARVNEIKARYESWEDEDLIRKFKSTSGEEKMAIGMILKSRGYGKQN